MVSCFCSLLVHVIKVIYVSLHDILDFFDEECIHMYAARLLVLVLILTNVQMFNVMPQQSQLW